MLTDTLSNCNNKMLRTMSSIRISDDLGIIGERGRRSNSAQGLTTKLSSPGIKIPLPPRLWITDVEDESSDDNEISVREDGVVYMERTRVRSRFRHHKQRSLSIPIGIFWDIENCQVPRGCSALEVVSAIRAKFLTGRREADFVVVCDVRKESAYRLQELNDAQVSLIHVCGTQKNAADEKLRQCMRRFGELHSAPAALLLISGDINFAADLSDFRHRKNMEVILVHKQNTSSALIACASSHYCFNELTASLPRNPKVSQTEDDDEPTCDLEVANLPMDQPSDRVSRRLRRLADNCGGKILKVTAPTAVVRFPTLDHSSRALKRMDGEDVFGRKISTRYVRGSVQPVYSSDEGYGTSQPVQPMQRGFRAPASELSAVSRDSLSAAANEWARALQQLPAPTPPPLDVCPPPAPKPRIIRGTHGSVNLDQSGSSVSGDEGRGVAASRAVSPWNSSSLSERSDDDSPTELTVSNLPLCNHSVLQVMLVKLFSRFVHVVRVSIWAAVEGPIATVVFRSESDARVAIARVHKRRLDYQWMGRRLDLSLGRPSPAPNLDVLRKRLRAILLDQSDHTLPLLRLRDAYASRHCCALTTFDLLKLKDTVIVRDGFGRLVELIDLRPLDEVDETSWKCHVHAKGNGHEDESRILQPVYMEIGVLASKVQVLLRNHGGILPLLSFVDCYEATFPPLLVDPQRGVALELLLRSVPGVEVQESPSRRLVWRDRPDSPPNGDCSRNSSERERPRTAPTLEPMLALFERELIDLLRTAPRCSISFSKLIPSFHHHFGRQCRVADYGFTKLPDLLAALTNTIVVLGSGSSRTITLSAAAQTKRWISDLTKVLKAQSGRVVRHNDVPHLYQATFERIFSPVDYGVCSLAELLERVKNDSSQNIILSPNGTLALPRRTPTLEERSRTVEFAVQAMELLCYTANLRMEFSRFVPEYHAHFQRQLRVAHYGCVKLIDLFELIPETVIVVCEPSGERTIRLSPRAARSIIAQRLRVLTPVPFASLSTNYAAQFGAPPLPDILNATSLEGFIYAAGGCIEEGIVCAPGDSPRWASGALAACAVLCADRSVARGSTDEYFVNGFRRLRAVQPDLNNLVAAGVVERSEQRVRLTTAWRTVWRVAQLLADRSPLTAMEVFIEYTKRYEPFFSCSDLGVDVVSDFLCQYREVFTETSMEPVRWALCPGVSVPRCRDVPAAPVDYTLYDTPPGQKGSRVFESPTGGIWNSPPASALPPPNFRPQENKRHCTRLAAHFEAL